MPSTSGAPHSRTLSASAIRRKSTKSLSVSKESLKLSSNALRTTKSESSLKTMSVKPKRAYNKDDFLLTPNRFGPSDTGKCGVDQQLLKYSNSDSKLCSTSESVKSSQRRKWSSRFGCAAESQKKATARKTQVCRYIWRCFLVTLVCCLTDIATFVYNAYTQLSSSHLHTPLFLDSVADTNLHFEDQTINNTYYAASHFEERVTISLLSVMAYNGNMIINLVCMVLCYEKFLEMLLPCLAVSRSVPSVPAKSDK